MVNTNPLVWVVFPHWDKTGQMPEIGLHNDVTAEVRLIQINSSLDYSFKELSLLTCCLTK